MMGRRNGKGPSLELKLNLSPPRASLSSDAGTDSPPRSSTSSSTPSSLPSSCLSSEAEMNYSSSPEPAASMVLAGCPRCLMYVILSEDDPRCPRCGSAVLLDFLGEPKNGPGEERRSGEKNRRRRRSRA